MSDADQLMSLYMHCMWHILHVPAADAKKTSRQV